jgi:dihydrofolate reductase
MGKVVVSVMLSVDGFAAGAGGDVAALPMDGAFSAHNVQRVRAASRLLFGGTGFRGMLTYWPAKANDPDAHPDDAYIARRYAEGLPITVISDSITADELGVWAGQTSVVRRDDAVDEIARLRADEEGEIVMFGSATTWTALLAAGLVDELYVLVGPAIVAGDRAAFAGVPAMDLRLLDVRSFAGSGTVVLHYAAENARTTGVPGATR